MTNTPFVKTYDVVGYAAEASAYCVPCAQRKYGFIDEPDFPDSDSPILDREGSPVRPIFAGDEWDHAPSCDSCWTVLAVVTPQPVEGSVPIANPEDYIATGASNPHGVRPWVIGNEYGALAIAYASHEQEALDIAADADLLKGLALDRETAREREEEDGGEGIMCLGNASEPYDSIYAWIHKLPNHRPEHYAALTDHEVFDLYRPR